MAATARSPSLPTGPMRGTWTFTSPASGRCRLLNTVTVRTRIDGAIDSIYFVEGQTVYTGDPLFQIDPRPYQVQVAQAEAQLAKDQSILDNAKNDLKRNEDAAGAVPQITIDQDRALVAQAEAALKIDAGQIASAKLNLTYTTITAPLTGRIGLKMVDSGNMVHASDASGLAVITQIQPIAVVFSLPEDNLPQIREHMVPRPPAAIFHLVPPFIRKVMQVPALRVEAYDRDMKQKIATGRLLAIDSQIDPTTGTVRLKGVFLNQDESLFPNQFVNARLLVDVLKNVVIIPTAAVQQSPKGAFVYVIKPDKTVEMRPVEVGASEGDNSVILSGVSGPKSQSRRALEALLAVFLKGGVKSAADLPHFETLTATEGELVVVDGVDKLQEGTKVAPRRAGSDPSTQPASGAGPAGGGDPAKSHQGQGGKSGEGKLRDGSTQGGARGDKSGAPAASQGAAMSPSRPFILRPIATSLLMVAILLAGAIAYRQLPVSALPQVDYPTIQVITFYPGASPEVTASSITAPLEKQFGQVPGLTQMTSSSSGGSSVITLQFDLSLEHRHRRAGGAGGDQRFGQLPAEGPAQSADLQQDQPGRRADPHAGINQRRAAAVEGGRPRRHAAGAEDVAASGRRPGEHQRRSKAGRAGPGESDRTRVVWPEPGRPAVRASSAANVNQAKGNIDGRMQAYTIGANDQILSSDQYRPLVVTLSSTAHPSRSPTSLTWSMAPRTPSSRRG